MSGCPLWVYFFIFLFSCFLEDFLAFRINISVSGDFRNE